tara:strand:+ start:4461 stop:5042 length:582 start_codon:yes stop_codon:yes gene_type:complete
MELLQYTVLDFILFFGAYMGGVILHELCHWIAGKVLAQNVSMSLFGLRVEYDVPTENVARIRWISLSPLLLAILIVTSTFALGIVDNLFIWLVVIGLVINTSSSDLSIRKALGETIFIDDLHRSFKIAATGFLLYALSNGIPRLETSTYPQQLFLHYLGSSFQTAGILLMVVGVSIYFYDDVHQLKNSATSDE